MPKPLLELFALVDGTQSVEERQAGLWWGYGYMHEFEMSLFSEFTSFK